MPVSSTGMTLEVAFRRYSVSPALIRKLARELWRSAGEPCAPLLSRGPGRYTPRMALNMIKLCVGAEDIEDQRAWQDRRLAQEGEVYHVTRMFPRRAGELLDGGSLYWVIKGVIQVRQRFTDIVPITDAEGIRRCKLVFDPELVATRPQPRRAFQGWRYFLHEDVPPDLAKGAESDGLPPKMRADLVELGLI